MLSRKKNEMDLGRAGIKPIIHLIFGASAGIGVFEVPHNPNQPGILVSSPALPQGKPFIFSSPKSPNDRTTLGEPWGEPPAPPRSRQRDNSDHRLWGTSLSEEIGDLGRVLPPSLQWKPAQETCPGPSNETARPETPQTPPAPGVALQGPCGDSREKDRLDQHIQSGDWDALARTN